MRPFEIALAASMILFVWWTALSGRPRGRVGDLGGIVLVGGVAGIQYFAEGSRWQLVPLYLAAGVIVTVSAWNLVSPAARLDDGGRGWVSAFWGTVGVAVAAALPLTLPVVDSPSEPAGLVGTLSHVLVDESRQERYGPAPGGPRQVPVQIWYPAASVNGVEPAALVDDLDSLGPAASEYLGFPRFFLDHLSLSRTNSYRAAPALDGTFPVVIYSHGWAGFRTVALHQMEALAGAGFVVVAVDHTYAALSTNLRDGSPARIDVDALPSEAAVGPETARAAREALSATFSLDIEFVLDELFVINAGSIPGLAPAAGIFDLDRIGLFGHSTGGGAVVTVCARDDRCDAVLGQDPWLEPVPLQVVRDGLTVPMLAVRSEEWLSRPNDALIAELAASSDDAVLAWIDGTVHRDFTVLPALSPLSAQLGLSGPLPTDRTIAIVDALNLAFFREHLAAGPSLGQVLSGFEELTFGS